MAYLKGGLTALSEMVNSLPPSEQKVAQYMVKYPNKAILLTAASLGKESGTSSTAVMRLCKSLGFSGFQELKIRVAGDLQHTKTTDQFRDVESGESVDSIIDKVTKKTIHTLQETVDILSINAITEAVAAFINAKSIIFIGFGASKLAAADAEQKFLRVDKNAICCSDFDMAASIIATKGKEDVVVGFSFSGETEDVCRLMERAKDQQIQTLSITKYGASPVSKLADITLFTSTSSDNPFRREATTSYMAQMHLINILFMCYVSAQYDDANQYLDQMEEAISLIYDKH